MTEEAEGAALRCMAAGLDSLGVGWALVGGLALIAYGVAWPCRDIDIAVATPDDAATAAVAAGLRACGHLVVHEPHDKLGDIVVVCPRMAGSAPAGVLFDLLPRGCGFEAEIVAAARRMPVRGLDAPVARPGHLIAYKVKAMHDVRRDRDREHLRALLRLSDDADRQLARQALRLSLERRPPRPGHTAATDATMLESYFRLLDEAETMAMP